MLFNSNAFLFAFLPTVLVGFLLISRAFSVSYAQLWLGAVSIIFYGWTNWRFVPLLLFSVTVNYFVGRTLSKRRTLGSPTSTILGLGIAFDLLLLGYFKYAGFLDANVQALTGETLGLMGVVLPIGISFYTFTQIAFLVDAAKGDAAEYDFKRYVLFVTFFPHLIAGPILHHKEMMPQFARLVPKGQTLENLSVGLVLLAIGLAKKCLIADPLGSFASPIFARADAGEELHFFIAWAGVLAYTFQIYFDFSGYSEMAIGLARMFGVKFPANFNSPYRASSIIDFWRRWHMTLSRFLRDYVYVPLGGNRKGALRRYVNLMAVMLVGGLWHGASWTFVLWGGLHGLYLLINHAWNSACDTRLLPASAVRAVGHASWALTFFAVTIAWVTFRAESLDGAFRLYQAMFLFDGVSLPVEAERFARAILPETWASGILFFAENSRQQFYLGLTWIVVSAAIAFLMPNALQITASAEPTTDFAAVSASWPKTAQRPVLAAFSRNLPRLALGTSGAIACGMLLFLAVRTINAAVETEFLYFQF
jgi:D-alanyl-lipoteichoic acid acyltransferase DltB (MBOAT superfamily)